MKKTLVFHFYVPKEYKENEVIRMHLVFLKEYAHIFDSAIFSICFEEKTDELVNEVEHDILSLGFNKDIRMVIEENTILTESVTFKKHIIDRLGELEGMVFFGHTKGVTNKKDHPKRYEDIKKWIYALYFYNLEFVGEVERMLFYSHPWQATFYGALRTTYDKGVTFNYPGTFFWLNPSLLYNDIESGLVKIPKVANRSFVEDLPFIYTESETLHRVVCHNNAWTHPCGYYNVDFDIVVKFFGDFELFTKRYNELMGRV